MIQKKNKFFRLLFSLLPGAGEMYMGFMKMGVSLMALFYVVMAVAAFLNLDFMIFICAIIWFYSFFNVHNLAGLPEEEFCTVEDRYLLHFNQLLLPEEIITKLSSRAMGVFLMIVGFYIIAREIWRMVGYLMPKAVMMVLDTFFYNTPRFLVGIGIIILGVFMIRGKKKQLDQWEKNYSLEQKENM